MQKPIKFLVYPLAFIIMSLFVITSCSDDETDPVNPPTLTTLAVTEITQTYAKSGGNISDDGGSEITARGVVWSMSQGPTMNDNEGITNDGTGAGEFTSHLTDLQQATTYYVRAYAINDAGTSYGIDVMFETLPDEDDDNGDDDNGDDDNGDNDNGDDDVIYGDGVTDVDGNEYETVIIGGQEWMAHNLRTTKYTNGNDIPTDLHDDDWGSAWDGAYAIYDHEEDNTFGIDSPEEMVEIYGLLYNRYAIEQDNLCPEGWTVPSNEDWQELVDHLMNEYGYSNDTGDPEGVGQSLKVARQVNHPSGGSYDTHEHPRWDGNSMHYGLDRFGFSGLPAGVRTNNGGHTNIGQYAYWWSSSEEDGSPMISPFVRLVDIQNNFIRSNINDRSGISVRCIKED